MANFTDELHTAFAGRYEVERELSRSAMSTVYAAFDVKHRRSVAIKVLPPKIAGVVENDRFIREIQVLAQLQHPHILPLFDSGEAAGALFYVMPFVEGETLRARMQREGRLSVQEACRLTREACDALAYAHSHGIIHRDIKPENILISSGHALVVDFGIARAIDVATLGSMTGSGVAIGTPVYMSPEQASGERDLDGRSDIFSLACVLYEMLSGRPPHADASGRLVLARRMSSPPMPVRSARGEVSSALEQVLQRALAVDRQERYPTAEAFADALLDAVPDTGRRAGSFRATGGRWRMIVGVAAVGVLLASGWMVYDRVISAPPPVDEGMFVVLPFAESGIGAAGALDGGSAARLVTDAVAQWRGIRLVDDMRVRDALSGQRRAATTTDQAFDVARSLGAGRLIWGSVDRLGDSVRVAVQLYDVNRETQIADRPYSVVTRADDVAASIVALSTNLMTEVAGASSGTGDVGTRDVEALRLYLRGHALLNAWVLDSAATLFERAAKRDTSFARAHFWAAQTLAWQPWLPRTGWEASAMRAVTAGTRLPPQDRTRAAALLALARGEYAAACTHYDSLLAADSLDFAAWYGRGECLNRDRLVVPDRRSPSGWRFRSSPQAAVSAYAQSLRLAPAFQSAYGAAAVSRLERLLLATPNEFYAGYSATADSQQFGAFPALDGDTLALVPYPAEDFLAAKPGTRPTSRVHAIDRNREMLRDLAARWVREAPDNAAAHAHLALALENLAQLEPLGGAPSALGEILEARLRSTTPSDRQRFASIQLRILLKLERWGAAAALADTMLAAPLLSAQDARLAGAAALLTGRLQRAVELYQASARAESLWTPRGTIPLPVSVADPAHELTVYASVGAPGDVLRPLITRAEAALDAWSRADFAPFLRAAMLDIPVALAFETAGLSGTHLRAASESRYLDMQLALRRGDSARVRGHLHALEIETATERPGDAGTEFVLLEAQARLALGDTVKARQAVAQAVTNIRHAGRVLTEQGASIGSLLRLLRLDAELAGHGSQGGIKPKSAAAVLALWQRADSILYPVRARMRGLAGARQ